MSETIGQRELRNDNAAIMRRVEQGESFVITRHGKPIADLLPHQVRRHAVSRRRVADVQATFRRLPAMDLERWYAERAADDRVFGSDNFDEDAWPGQPAS